LLFLCSTQDNRCAGADKQADTTIIAELRGNMPALARLHRALPQRTLRDMRASALAYADVVRHHDAPAMHSHRPFAD
jgi:hypothetical protein